MIKTCRPFLISCRANRKTVSRASRVAAILVVIGMRFLGISSSTEISRLPRKEIASVRGIGVAVRVRRCGVVFGSPSFEFLVAS